MNMDTQLRPERPVHGPVHVDDDEAYSVQRISNMNEEELFDAKLDLQAQCSVLAVTVFRANRDVYTSIDKLLPSVSEDTLKRQVRAWANQLQVLKRLMPGPAEHGAASASHTRSAPTSIPNDHPFQTHCKRAAPPPLHGVAKRHARSDAHYRREDYRREDDPIAAHCRREDDPASTPESSDDRERPPHSPPPR